MRTKHLRLVLAGSLLSMLAPVAVAAADPDPVAPRLAAIIRAPAPQTAHIGALIHEGRPVLDPLSPWLMSSGWPMDGSFRLVDARHVQMSAVDGNSNWLLPDRIAAEPHQQRGIEFAGQVQLGDPRFIGWLTLAWSRDLYLVDDAAASVDAVDVDLRGDGGDWIGSLSGTGAPTTGSFLIGGTLAGTGAYTGSLAIVSISASGGEAGWVVQGMVVRGDGSLD